MTLRTWAVGLSPGNYVMYSVRRAGPGGGGAEVVGQQWVKGQMGQQARYRSARPAAPPLPLAAAPPPPPRRHRRRLHHQELTFDLFLFIRN